MLICFDGQVIAIHKKYPFVLNMGIQRSCWSCTVFLIWRYSSQLAGWRRILINWLLYGDGVAIIIQGWWVLKDTALHFL